MAIGGSLLLLFLLDTILSWPFGRISMVVDIVVIVASATLIYMSWNASRDLP
jgi:hypothetical protein